MKRQQPKHPASRKHKKKRSVQHACNKRRFRDHGEAVDALRAVRATSNRQTVPARAYECGRCNGWHLTSQA